MTLYIYPKQKAGTANRVDGPASKHFRGAPHIPLWGRRVSHTAVH